MTYVAEFFHAFSSLGELFVPLLITITLFAERPLLICRQARDNGQAGDAVRGNVKGFAVGYE